tara:strand:+ start:3691 stop:3927 length:237 start_codon:yes stop_codon:yes gene_type:complete
MNGKDWNKNDTSYYAVYYREEYGESIDVVTNDFGGWLKKTNEDRVDEDHPDYEIYTNSKYKPDDFLLKDVEVFSRKGK